MPGFLSIYIFKFTMFLMPTSQEPELLKAHGPVVGSGLFYTFPWRWEDPHTLPNLLYQAPPWPRTYVVILLVIPKVVQSSYP